jgi:arsenate reductase
MKKEARMPKKAPPKAKVLFLCTGNSARSQMGEALLRRHGGDLFEVYSAGIEPRGIHPYTVRVLNEIGVDTSRQYSKSVNQYLGHVNFGYLITVCSEADAKCPTTFLGVSQRLRWPFEDPAAFKGTELEKLEKFRAVRDQIEAKIRQWVSEQARLAADDRAR